jgi:hypothetical protein
VRSDHERTVSSRETVSSKVSKFAGLRNWSAVSATSHNDSTKLRTPNTTERDDIDFLHFVSRGGEFNSSFIVMEPNVIRKCRVLEMYYRMMLQELQGKWRLVRIIMVRPTLEDLIHRNRQSNACQKCGHFAHCFCRVLQALIAVIRETSMSKGNQEVIS